MSDGAAIAILAAAVVAAAVYGWLTYLVLVYLFWPTLPLLVVAGFAGGVALGAWVFVATLVGVGVPPASVIGPDSSDDDRWFRPTRSAFPRDVAWPHYLAGQVRADLVACCRNGHRLVTSGWSWSRRTVTSVPALWWFWPVLLFPVVAGAALSVGALAMSVVLTVLAGVLLAVAAGGWLLVAVVFRLLDRTVRLRRRAKASCPHPGCNYVTDLPSFQCRCGRIHRDIRPGMLGVAVRQCRCGRRLPTTVLRAASVLPALCPKCDRPLRRGAGALCDIRLPVLGPVSAGKTRFVHAGMLAVERYLNDMGWRFEPADGASARALTDGADTVVGGGATVKTPADRPPAAISARVGRTPVTALMHLFDPAGELLREREQNATLHFLDEAQGFVLVVDPFSIGHVRDELAGEFVDRLEQANAAQDDPETSYQVTAQRLRDSGALLGQRSLAVIVVKADLLLELPPGRGLDGGSANVRSWLLDRGVDNLVLSTERDFGQVRYFLVSSVTGWRPDDPLTAAAPLLWLLGRAGLQLPAADAAVSA